MKNSKKKEALEQMVRINHAGEYAAKYIYQGQLRFIRDHKAKALIKDMARSEDKHFEYFDQQIQKNGYRPTILQPLIKQLAFGLGAITALIGTKAAMLCTHAVEEVICDHYQEQEQSLNDQDELKSKIAEFRAEEAEHHATADQYDLNSVAGRKILEGVIKVGCRLGIKLTKYF